MLIKIAIALLVIAGLALGGEMTLTAARIKEVSRSDAIVKQPAASVRPIQAGIRCPESKAHRHHGRGKACVA